MKQKKVIIEFAIENLVLKKRLVSKKKTTHTVLVTLIWPRPAIKEKKLFQTVKIDKNGNMQLDLSWDKTILGKETVQGPFAIKIAVFRNMSSKKQADFFRYLIAETAKEIGDYASDILDIPLASDVVDIPFDYFAKKFGAENEDIGIIGSTCMNIEINSAKDNGQTSDLTTPRDFYTSKTLTRAGKRTRVRKKILKKGDVIGNIQIALKVYE